MFRNDPATTDLYASRQKREGESYWTLLQHLGQKTAPDGILVLHDVQYLT